MWAPLMGLTSDIITTGRFHTLEDLMITSKESMLAVKGLLNITWEITENIEYLIKYVLAI